MKSADNIYIFLIALFSIVPFFLAEYFIGDFILVPAIEALSIFFIFVFLIKTSSGSFDSIAAFFSFWYLLLKAAILSVYMGTGNTHVLANFIFGFFWINFTIRGIKNKDKMYWLLWFVVGVCVNIILNLVYK